MDLVIGIFKKDIIGGQWFKVTLHSYISYLKPLSTNNILLKYADDITLLVPSTLDPVLLIKALSKVLVIVSLFRHNSDSNIQLTGNRKKKKKEKRIM